jgi:thymidylate synthase
MKNKIDQKYLALLEDVTKNGVRKNDRTGVGTLSTFGRRIRFKVGTEKFPIVTRKKTHFQSLKKELIWFLSGSSNVKYLQESGVGIWDEWADPDGELGPVYGVQWRSWPKPYGGSIDQIQGLIQNLKDNPDSRRHVVSAWNVGFLDEMNLPPCHLLFQAYSTPLENGDRELSLQVYQRSCDLFLGVPFNLSSYSLLLTLLANQTGHKPGELIWVGGDVHVYSNHLDQVERFLQLPEFELPSLRIKRDVSSIDEYKAEDIELVGYESGPFIKAPIAV